MIKKRKFCLSHILAILLIIPAVLLLVGCGNNTLEQLSNAKTGITVSGGEFENGSELNVTKLDNSSQAGQEALERIANFDYNKTKAPIIYDVKILKDNVTIQPKASVTVSMNAPYQSENGFVVFHIADENNVEKLDVNYTNGKITFSVSHFSVLIIAEDLDDSQTSTQTNFIFKLEMDKNDENDDSVKSIEFYSTGEHDGKSAEWEVKVDGEVSENGVDTTLSANAWYAGIMINSSTAYKNCEFGTLDQQFGLLDGYHTHDGKFGGKITINSNYKLFWVQELQSSSSISFSGEFRAKLIEVETDKMQILNEGQYILVRNDVFQNAISQGKNNENGDLCETIANLIRPKDDGNGQPMIEDVTAAYVFSIQFAGNVKNS